MNFAKMKMSKLHTLQRWLAWRFMAFFPDTFGAFFHRTVFCLKNASNTLLKKKIKMRFCHGVSHPFHVFFQTQKSESRKRNKFFSQNALLDWKKCLLKLYLVKQKCLFVLPHPLNSARVEKMVMRCLWTEPLLILIKPRKVFEKNVTVSRKWVIPVWWKAFVLSSRCLGLFIACVIKALSDAIQQSKNSIKALLIWDLFFFQICPSCESGLKKKLKLAECWLKFFSSFEIPFMSLIGYQKDRSKTFVFGVPPVWFWGGSVSRSIKSFFQIWTFYQLRRQNLKRDVIDAEIGCAVIFKVCNLLRLSRLFFLRGFYWKTIKKIPDEQKSVTERCFFIGGVSFLEGHCSGALTYIKEALSGLRVTSVRSLQHVQKKKSVSFGNFFWKSSILRPRHHVVVHGEFFWIVFTTCWIFDKHYWMNFIAFKVSSFQEDTHLFLFFHPTAVCSKHLVDLTLFWSVVEPCETWGFFYR